MMQKEHHQPSTSDTSEVVRQLEAIITPIQSLQAKLDPLIASMSALNANFVALLTNQQTLAS